MNYAAPPATSQPHNLQAEKTVLGALLIDPQAISKVAAMLRPGDFCDPVFAKLFEGCLALHERSEPVDAVTLANELANFEKLQGIGGAAFLIGLAPEVPTASHVENYVHIVHEAAGRRSLITAGQKIVGVGLEESSLATATERAHEALLGAGNTNSRSAPESLSSVAERRYDEIAQVQQSGDPSLLRRIKTSFSNLDYYFDGFAPGSMTVIAARPSMGKTALVTNIALNAASGEQTRVLFFSLEMTKEELSDRITAARLGVSTWQVEKGDISDEQVQALGGVIDSLQDCPLYIDDDPDTTLSNLRTKAIRHQLEHGVGLVIVDYLQLVELPRDARHKENRVQEISTISRGLKQLARELGVPLIALSKLNRAVESALQAIPHLSHLRESGSIEQDAHNVLMLWREGYYDEDCEHPDQTTIFIRKNRQGPTGAAELMFEKQLMTFTSLDRSHSDETTN